MDRNDKKSYAIGVGIVVASWINSSSQEPTNLLSAGYRMV
jgi:hypothetical protein